MYTYYTLFLPVISVTILMGSPFFLPNLRTNVRSKLSLGMSRKNHTRITPEQYWLSRREPTARFEQPRFTKEGIPIVQMNYSEILDNLDRQALEDFGETLMENLPRAPDTEEEIDEDSFEGFLPIFYGNHFST